MIIVLTCIIAIAVIAFILGVRPKDLPVPEPESPFLWAEREIHVRGVLLVVRWRAAGLVRDRAVGTRRVYQLDPTGLEALRADLDRFWAQALATYAQTVEDSKGGPA